MLKKKMILGGLFLLIVLGLMIPVKAATGNNTLIWVDTPVEQEAIEPGTLTIQGWIMSQDVNAKIHILLDNQEQQVTIQRQSRPDVIQSIKGYGDQKTNPTPGYIATLNTSSISKGTHQLKIRVTKEDHKTILSEKSISIKVGVYDTLIQIDQPNMSQTEYQKIAVTGWVMSEYRNTKLEGYIDGTKIQNPFLRVARSDVLKAIQGYGGRLTNLKPGYTGMVDISNLTTGKHTFTLKVFTSEGTILETKSVSFTIRKPDTLLQTDFPKNQGNPKTSLNVQGWLLSEDKNAKIQITFNGKTYTPGRQARPDVLNAIGGFGGKASNATPGYQVTIDTSKLKDGNYPVKIEVFSGKGELLKQEVRNIALLKYESILQVDSPITNGRVKNSLHVQGWTLTEDKEAKVEVVLNGKTYATTRQARADVFNVIKGFGGKTTNLTPGYIVDIDTTAIKDGNYPVVIKTIARTGEILKQETRMITIHKYDGMIQLDSPKVNQQTKTSLHVQGWVMVEDPNAEVQIIVSGKTYSTQRQERADVLNAIKDFGGKTTNKKPGYTGTVDTTGLKDGSNSITVQIVASKTGEIITKQTRNINVKKYEGMVQIDYPQITMTNKNTVQVQGWEMSEYKNSTVSIYIDNKLVTNHVPRQERPDVLNSIKGYGGVTTNPTPGYSTQINISGYSDGKHTIKVVILSNLGDVIASSEKMIQIYHNTYFGIDVSTWQGSINFDALSATKRVDFMIARTGYYSETKGKLMVDGQFERNYTEAKKKNIALGTYLYSYALNVEEAKREANALVSYLKSTGKTFTLPIFYDIEDPSQAGLSKQTQTEMCKAFGEIVKSAGYKVGIYASVSWFNNHIDLAQIPSDYDIWVAGYGINDGTVPPDQYKFPGNHDIWQYTSKGTIDGIAGDVDFNISYKKY